MASSLSSSGLNGRYPSAFGHTVGGDCCHLPTGIAGHRLVAYSVSPHSAVAIEITSIYRVGRAGVGHSPPGGL